MAFQTHRFTLCWPNRVEEAILSGEGWNASFPLTNLQDPIYDIKARSTGFSGSAEFTFAQQRKLGVVAMARHNLSTSGQWRVRLYYDSARETQVYDSGWVPVWPTIYTIDEIEWEEYNFWTGAIADEDRTLYTALATAFGSDNQTVGSGLIEVSDTGNPDGFITIGRLLLCAVWQPAINISYGVQYGGEIATTVERALSGTKYFDRRRRERTVSAALDYLTEHEAFADIGRAQQTQGTDREVLVAYRLVQDEIFADRTFVGQFTQPSAITHPRLSTFSVPITVQENI